MSNFTLSIYIDTRRPKKDMTFPIVIRVIYNRKNTTLSTNFSVKKSDWDERHEKIKKSCKKYSREEIVIINHEIQRKLKYYATSLLEAEKKEPFKNIKEVRNFLVHNKVPKDTTRSITFVKFTNQLVEDYKSQGRLGNAKAYNNAILFMRKYYRKDFSFKDLTPKILKRIEVRFLSKGYSYNGLAFNLRTVRAIYNKAIAEGHVNIADYPFKRHSYENDKYHIKHEKTKKRAIDKSVLKKIENYQVKENTGRYNARNYFLFSFYCRGINLRDMAKLRKSNIQEGILHYRRAKTKLTYEIPLTDKAKAILQLYGFDKKSMNDFLFPIITRSYDLELMEKDMYNATQTTNKNLQKIAKELDISAHLTTYVARHSWATIADQLGVDRRTISQGLGHTSLNTTEIYINDIVSSEDLSKADDLIIG